MKKIFKLKNLGCASCANIMEDKIAGLDSVEKVSVNFMLSRMTIETKEGQELPSKEDLQAILHTVEPDCVLV